MSNNDKQAHLDREKMVFTDSQIESICMSYRHDFGLLPKAEKAKLKQYAKYWIEAINKELINSGEFDVDAVGSVKHKLDENLNIIHEQETILCSAILIKDGKQHLHQPVNIHSGFVVCGRRHHNCFRTIEMIYQNIEDFKKHKNVQGFLTQTDRFVDRDEAMKIAIEAKQVPKCVSKCSLISEWIW